MIQRLHSIKRTLCFTQMPLVFKATRQNWPNFDMLRLFTRRSDTDRITERDFVTAQVQHLQRDVGHFFRADGALVRAPDDAGYVAPDFDPVLGCKVCDVVEPLKAFVDRAVDVLPAEGLRCGAENGDLGCARFESRF